MSEAINEKDELKARVMNYNGQLYNIKDIEVKNIVLEPHARLKATQMSILYKGAKFEEKCFVVPHTIEGKLNTQHIGACMLSLLERNKVLTDFKDIRKVKI